MTEFEVSNLVGMITFRQQLDLKELAKTFEERDEVSEVIYEPAENHWLQTRFAPDDTYVPFYRSGKCSIVGTTSEEQFYEVAGRVTRLMEELLEFEYEPKVEFSNIVATADLDTTVNLEALAISIGLESVEYEPEQFPGLIYPEDDFVALIFASGQIVCTGLTDFEKLEDAVGNVLERVNELSVV